MEILINVGKEVFDFFCGDVRIFMGVVTTIVALALIDRFGFMKGAGHALGILLIIGISLSLIIALRHEIDDYR